ncbi:MAG TPA: hypothetical protein ENG78_07305 [Acidiferrobacteraceae bacterium]|nr:hypothetical protein [Acidiferrobacteraceae bacterium]HEX20607.1 hypothetical protein [Acidiferrobacteraceae bacterium]
MAISVTLHILAAVIWVGGMFFAYLCLRPAAQAVLEPEQRLTLWVNTFDRFFVWVFIAIIVILASGYWMIFNEYGGFKGIGINIEIMQVLGIIMMLIFAHVYFAPFKRLKRFVAARDFPQAGKNLQQIRVLVAINLVIGLATIIVAAAGPHLLYSMDMN